MSASGFPHVPARLPARRRSGSRPPGATGSAHPHGVGDSLHAIKVYVITAFEVAVLGEYARHPHPPAAPPD